MLFISTMLIILMIIMVPLIDDSDNHNAKSITIPGPPLPPRMDCGDKHG